MERELFDKIFDNEIFPFVREVDANNGLIEIKNLEIIKESAFRAYKEIKKQYKEQIFEKDVDNVLLDRHKIASSICGAFLQNPVFNITKMIKEMKKTGSKYEVYFYYVNEMVAFYAATAYLSFFMVCDREDQEDVIRLIVEKFPMMPPTNKNKRGFWNSVVFNLSQIKDENQIGLEHYDVYSYAMFYYWLEKDFNDRLKS